MTMRLTSEQEALALKAVEAGMVPSVEEFVSVAIQALDQELNVTAEDFRGMPAEHLRKAIQDGLRSGDAQPWEGAASFNARMRTKHQRRLDASDSYNHPRLPTSTPCG